MTKRKTNVNPSLITMVPYDMDTNEYNAIVFEIGEKTHNPISFS